jgi:hypothetical protein
MKKCCDDKLVVKQNMFFWKGKYFSGLVCEEHNSLFENPEDSLMDHIRNLKQLNPKEDD